MSNAFAVFIRGDVNTGQVMTLNQRPRMMSRGAYHDRRSRGFGGFKMTAGGEENLLSLQGDPYRSENIMIYEFAHTIASNLRHEDRAWWNQLEELDRRDP